MLIEYFRDKKDIYILYILLLVIEAVVFMLANFSIDILAYFMLIAVLILIIYTMISFIRYRHNRLEIRYSNVYIDTLKANTFIEQDYINKLNDIVKELQTLQQQDNKKYHDMVNYYTIWLHQIKTPLSALKLLIQKDNNQQMLLEILKIEQYVNMVLQYIRLERINNDLSFQYISLDQLVSEVLKKQVQFFSLSKISLDYTIDDQIILTDTKWSSFVIEQILSNALKYTKQGKIEIYNQQEKLYIKDSGIGIRSEDLPRVFENGFTGFNGREDKKATGIGLYLSKTILDKLDHSIHIESKVNVGTVVCIDFHKEKMVIE